MRINAKSSIHGTLFYSVLKYFDKNDIEIVLNKTKNALLRSGLDTPDVWKFRDPRPGQYWLYELNFSLAASELMPDNSLSELLPVLLKSNLFRNDAMASMLVDATVKHAGMDSLLSKLSGVSKIFNEEGLKDYRDVYSVNKQFYSMDMNEFPDLESLLSEVQLSVTQNTNIQDNSHYLIVILNPARARGEGNDKPYLMVPVDLMIALGHEKISSSIKDIDKIIFFDSTYSKTFSYVNGSQGYSHNVFGSIIDAKTGKSLLNQYKDNTGRSPVNMLACLMNLSSKLF
jgi:hypothetical protein